MPRDPMSSHQHRTLPATVRRLGLGWATFSLVAVPLAAQVQQPTTLVRDTLRPFATFRSTVLSVDSTRLVLSAPTALGRRELHLSPALLRRLSPLQGQTFTAVAEERPTPAGLQAAIVLREGGVLRVVAEVIRDVPVLRPVDRAGMSVRLAPAEPRTVVFEDQCRTVYGVPSLFTISGEAFVVRPYETRTVRTKDGAFTISLGTSQMVVQKECPVVFEGSRQYIEYVITRNP